MKKFFKVAVVGAYLAMLGCAPAAVPVEWTPSGGSRADATVEMGVIYAPGHEYPVNQPAKLLEMARERCRAWGYADAEVFGQPIERCTSRTVAAFGQVVCLEMQAKQVFQCLGRGVLPVPMEGEMGKKITP